MIELARRGEEVVITSRGQAVAKPTGISDRSRSRDRQAWLAKLSELRRRVATGKRGLTVEQILDEARGAWSS